MLLRLLVIVLVLFAPASALACPTCAIGRQDDGSGRLVMLGGMIALPFLVAIAVLGAVRRALRDDS